MAVYTVLDAKIISDILKEYELGILQRFEPISSGIENTNYFIWTEKTGEAVKQWVLTIFENVQQSALPFFNDLTLYLSHKGFAVPAPLGMRNGQHVFSIEPSIGTSIKYGVIVPKFDGKAFEKPSKLACQKVAMFVANMHTALSDFDGVKEIQHSYAWCKNLVDSLKSTIPKSDCLLLTLALERYQAYGALLERCTTGVVHGDLFRDNVLFDKNEISGVIDFYNAGRTAYLFDLAVIANDWAINFEGVPAFQEIYDEEKLKALVDAYQSIKPFTKTEQQAWPRLLELAALRFYLSRLKTKYIQGYQQDVKEGQVIKSPDAMKMILLAAMAR